MYSSGSSQYPPLPIFQRGAYRVGHVLNDLCASMWFSYLLVYFHNVLLFSNILAGYLMLLGQIIDAICTPFVGYETDRSKGCCKYGRRKSWHLVGTLSVVCSFAFLFMQCIGCAHSADWAKFIYYAPFVVIFQFGWATTQISHLSLIPTLTPCESQRVELNSIRYAMTVVSNITVYGIAWALLSSAGGDESMLGPGDVDAFRNLALTVIGLGIVFSVIFHVGTTEQSEPAIKHSPSNVSIQGCPQDSGTEASPYSVLDDPKVTRVPVQVGQMIWKDWLKERQFYQIAGVYMCTRLMVNLSQIYIPMFLTHSLQLQKEFIAIVPLVVFISGFLASVAMRKVNKKIGRKGTYVLGLLLIGASCVWFWSLHYLPPHLYLLVFCPAVLLGLGGSTVLVTSLSMTADLIGNNVNSGAFVYGAMSFTDKLSNGLAVVLIQHFHPCNFKELPQSGPGEAPCCAACVWYYRDCMAFIPGGVAVIALILLLTLIPTHIGAIRAGQGAVLAQSQANQGEETQRLLGNGAGQNGNYVSA